MASSAKTPFLYTGEHAFHKGRVEEVTEIQSLMTEMLGRYQSGSASGRELPNAVMYFRDGVAEGQFKMVITYITPI